MEDHKSVPDKSEGYVCSKCGADVSISDKECPKCGTDISEIEEDEGEELMEGTPSKRYPALRNLVGLCKVLAWVVAIVASIGVLVALANLEKLWGIDLLLYSVIGGPIGFIIFLAESEIIKLFIDIEENTRKMAELQIRKIEEQK